MLKTNKTQPAFTIVELLIVIVVIAILAAISLAVYNGIQNRARTVAVQSDLRQASKGIKLHKVDKTSFPATVSADCEDAPDNSHVCLKLSKDNTIESYSSPSPHTTFSLTIIHTPSGISGTVTDSTGPIITGAATVPGGGGEDGIVIGDQVWAKTNVNVGQITDNTIIQGDNGVVEKYCYNNDETYCTARGGLYQWNEAMQYSRTPGARGVCTAGWHIPTDEEWKILETNLGMSRANADLTGWSRGDNQGSQLKPGGTTGMNLPLAGHASNMFRGFGNYGLYGYIWTSSESADRAWKRGLSSSNTKAYRHTDLKTQALSVRCIKD